MISVGIDVSKGKSTVCILKPYGEVVCKPFELQHNKKSLESLDELLQKLDGEVKIERLFCFRYKSLCNEEICQEQQLQKR